MRLSLDRFLCACVASLGLCGHSEFGGLAVATMLSLVFLPGLNVAVNTVREKDEPAADLGVLMAPVFAIQH
ncbi:hypothetical protein [Ensifer sp. LCM 4579]|uniref:hypothetical protein n=1 Tax=Ensifer sp. LCM 4579 TaxID=1848292 RepID=UPI0008DA9F30|nr:hypothetical protein [Ensifer sp. LCM 4579]OHV75396.1 hypothetical protein LCM4579_07690 [Ensifer sp. LCM 4579]